MKASKISCIFLLIFTMISLGNNALATSAGTELIVDVSLIPPCVMKSGATYSGFDIDLWEAIADDLDVQFTYRSVEFKDIFKDLKQNRADVGIAAITINEEREKYIDFSHHYLDSGLRILAPFKKHITILATIRSIFTPGTLKCLASLLIFILVCGHVLWLVERGKDSINDKYIPGIGEAFWCVLATMTTVGYGDITPGKWRGRFVAFLVMIIGISFFGIIIAQLTAGLTMQKISSDISNYNDLKGKVVATKEGTTSETVLKDIGAEVRAFPNIEMAYHMLLQGEASAVVFDSPSILYFAKNEGAGKLSVVGEPFDLQYYGFAFPQGSSLREKVNRSLLKLRSNGEYTRILKKWFH
ncbi:MAG: transporter substrate-binding domain-containing protein [bacterium]